MEIVINRKMKYFTLVVITSLLFSCKQDTKINLTEIKEGYYELEILEKYVYPPDSTKYLEYAISGSQIGPRPGFLIKKGNKNNYFQVCITYKNIIKPGCSPLNFNLELFYLNKDSIYLQKPWFYIDGTFNGSVPKFGVIAPNQFDSSSIKYQVEISGLKLNQNSEIEGLWKELVKCGYVNFDVTPHIIDSIVVRPIFAKFKLKFVKGI